MNSTRFSQFSVRVVSALVLLGAGLSGVVRGQTFTEFAIPTAGSGADSIAAGPDGNLWFTEQAANKIGRITTAGVITEFAIPTADSGPRGIAAGPDGNLWFTEGDGNKIGRITTAGVVTGEFPSVPTAPAGVVVGPRAIAAGPDGNLWFTEGASKIGRITTAGVVTEFSGHHLSSLQGIAAGPDGSLWFADYYGAQIGRITTSGDITVFSIPSEDWPSGIAAGTDGNLWFTEGDKIGRITTAGDVTEFSVSPGGSAQNIAAGPGGDLWFTDGSGNRIGRVDAGGDITEFPIPTAGSGPSGIAAGPDGALWFTETGSNRIGRLDVDSVSPCTPDVNSLCLAGNRFKVTAAWEATGRSGSGVPVSATSHSGYFWFFDPSNIEVFVKVLDNCATSGGHAVYVNGLTHLGVTITVTDTQTGASESYVNPLGKAFELIYDAETFRTCP